MNRTALDMYDEIPQAMAKYLRNYGYHFNRKAYELAVRSMKKKNPASGKGERLDPWTKEQVDEMLKRYNVILDNDTMYDAAYVANMCKADYFGSSITDEQHVALFVKDTIDDVDAADGHVFNRWYADTVRGGMPIEWEDLL